MTTWLAEFVRAGGYDEAAVLEQYLRHNYGQLMTRFERLALRAITTRDAPMLRTLAEMARLQYPNEDPDVVSAIAVGQETFLLKVFTRIRRDHSEKIVVNRCPHCTRIVASISAHQCLWCGHQWHQHPATAS